MNEPHVIVYNAPSPQTQYMNTLCDCDLISVVYAVHVQPKVQFYQNFTFYNVYLYTTTDTHVFNHVRMYYLILVLYIYICVFKLEFT